jgi:hypothetical protein
MIKFKKGKVYEYKNVPISVYRSLCNASSAGEFFTQNIKSNYSFEESSNEDIDLFNQQMKLLDHPLPVFAFPKVVTGNPCFF